MTTIAISHTWPDIKNAEYEVLQRLISAADLISVAVIVVDRHGTILWHSDGVAVIVGKTLQRGEADLLISLHFESPKVVDVYSYYALWQPIEFYSTFGYEKTTRSMLSHDDFLSCDSDIANAHGLNVFEAAGRSVPDPLPRLFHTLPQPFLEPKIDEAARVFYVGINWERLGKEKGRFHDVLVILANKDLVEIYGPELLLGVAPWQGFDAYQGELPFDGEAVKFALNRAGICLALSSRAHVETGIMSNRLFEGFAGGAAVICNSNPFLTKHFANEVFFVDSEKGEEALAMQIVQIVRKIRADPEAAKTRVLRAQQIMREKFALERNLERVVATHRERQESYERRFLASTSVTVIADFRGTDLSRLKLFVGSLRGQEKASIILYLLCDGDVTSFVEENVSSGGSLQAVHVLPLASATRPDKLDGILPFKTRRGSLVANILSKLDTDYFAFARPSQTFFAHHFALLASSMQRTDGARFGATMFVISSQSLAERTKQLDDATDLEEVLLNAEAPILDAGRFLFDSALAKRMPHHLFALLDGAEHLFFQVAATISGPLARVFQPTVDKDLQVDTLLPAFDERERQYIRDFFKFDPAWLRAATRSAVTVTVPAVDDEASSASYAEFPMIEPNRRYKTEADGDGLVFLVRGFSKPEPNFVWCLERGYIDFSLRDIRRLESFSSVFRVALAGRKSYQTGRPQYLTVAVNGSVIGYYQTSEVEGDLAIHMPISKLPCGNRFRLELIPDHAEPSYAASGDVLDPRLMSFYISSFVLEQTPYSNAPHISPSEEVVFSTTGVGRNMLAQGFNKPEDDLIWMAGRRAKIHFYITEPITSGAFEFKVLARTSIATGEEQRLSVTMNGRKLGLEVPLRGETECSFAFDRPLLGGDLIDLTFDLAHAEAVFDQNHIIVDPRLLGLAFRSMVLAGRKNAVRASDEVFEPRSRRYLDPNPA